MVKGNKHKNKNCEWKGSSCNAKSSIPWFWAAKPTDHKWCWRQSSNLSSGTSERRSVSSCQKPSTSWRRLTSTTLPSLRKMSNLSSSFRSWRSRKGSAGTDVYRHLKITKLNFCFRGRKTYRLLIQPTSECLKRPGTPNVTIVGLFQWKNTFPKWFAWMQ